MKCFCCDGTKWATRPKINPKRLLQICKTCGTMAMKVEPDDEQKMLDYYRKEYRPAPNHTNLLTTTNKQNYVLNFLRETLEKAAKGNKVMVCGDVGAATGYLVDAFKKMGHRSTGCELTVTFRRFSEAYYGNPLTEELEPKHKYDLITIYHVFEHMIEPDKKLMKYRDMLSDDGRIMIATPEWLADLEEQSGGQLVSVAHLFHEDHINVFTDKSIKALFAKCGMVVEKEDHMTYGQTYLLKKGDAPKPEEFYEPWEDVAKRLDTYVKAMDFYFKKKYKKAREVYPRFPEAWLKQILETCGKMPDKQSDLWEQCKGVLQDNVRVRIALGHWLYQMEDYENALKVFNEVIAVRPGAIIFMLMGWCYSNQNNHIMAMKCYQKCAEMDPTKWAECNNWITKHASSIPAWDEKAMDAFKQEVIEKKKPTFELKESLNGKQKPSTNGKQRKQGKPAKAKESNAV